MAITNYYCTNVAFANVPRSVASCDMQRWVLFGERNVLMQQFIGAKATWSGDGGRWWAMVGDASLA